LALGCHNGLVLVVTTTPLESLRLERPKFTLAVEDVQWDPKSDNYLLAAYKDGSMLLFDVGSGKELQVFERQGAGIKSIVWNSQVLGEVITCNDKVAALKVWNVSKVAPTDTYKIGVSGMKQIVYLEDQQCLVCAFSNGSVGLYSLTKKRLDFCTEPGHAETIFDVQFKPGDKDIMATASYDGTIKIWDVKTMKNLETLRSDALVAGQYKGVMHVSTVLYGIAWCPGQEPYIAACTAKGEVLLYDYLKNKLLDRVAVSGPTSVFRISWSTKGPDLIAVGTSDNFLVTLSVENRKLSPHKKLKHPKTVYGAVFSPLQDGLIATACHDGAIRIFNLGGDDAPIMVLQGHSSRSFNVAWHPILKDVLATSSDDSTICVWNYRLSTSPTVVLRGHTSNTRAVVWNSEIPWLLLSGAWDSTIRLWDVRSGNCLYVATEHHADIYGLATHFRRPFMYVSCSRDTSLRLWSVEDFVTKLLIRALLDQSLANVVGPPRERMDEMGPLALYGEGSMLAAKDLQGPSLVDAYRSIVTFFSFQPGETDFFDILNSALNGKPCPPNNQVLPVGELAEAYRSRAQELESASGMAFLGSALAKKEDRLQEAAKINMKLGNVQNYCELMIKVGKWERALAFSAGVSMEYWQNVAQRYAQFLSQNEKQDATLVYLAAGKVEKAIEFSLKRGDNSDALLIAASSPSLPKSSASDTVPPALEVKTGTQDYGQLVDITAHLAEEHFDRCEPVLAACCHLSLKEMQSAMNKLVRGHELIYALVLGKLTGVQHRDVLEMMIRRVEKMGDVELALLIAGQDQTLKELLLARSPSGPSSYAARGMRSPDEYNREGEERLNEGKLQRAVHCFVVAQNPARAADVVLAEARRLAQSPKSETILALMEAFKIIGYCPTFKSLAIPIQSEVLAFSALLGALQASWKGYSVAPILLSTYLNIMRHQRINPICSEASVQILSSILTSLSRETMLETLTEQLTALNLQGSDQQVAELLKQHLSRISNSAKANIASAVRKNEMKLVGSNLPASNFHVQAQDSVFSRRQIKGLAFPLMANKAYSVSLEEALMWAKVNPFSPMNDGTVINPF